MGELRDRMVMAMRMRNFSQKTIKCYLWQVTTFVRMYGKSPAEMGEEEVRGYLQSLVERKKSWSLVRIAYCALKFLYVDTLEREWKVERFLRPKGERRLPAVLSGEEVRKIFDAVRNVKHRMILMTCYSTGLRVGEAVHLKVTDIDSQRMQIRVEQGKGKKDRYTVLSTTLCAELRAYWVVHRPPVWLFPRGAEAVSPPLSVGTVQRAFRGAKKKLGSPKPSLSILFATVLPPTCWSPALTCSSSRDSWAIRV